jgi:hypothetical protein
MSHSIRLLIALGLAGTATYGNHMYLKSRLQSEQFAAATRALKPPATIAAEDLYPVSLSGEIAGSKEVLVRWDRRDEIIGRPIPREIAQHELLNVSSFISAVRLPVPAGKLGIFVPTDDFATVPTFLRPNMVVYFSVRRILAAGTEEIAEDPRMIGPFTVTAVDGITDPYAQVDVQSNRRPMLTIAAAPEELKQSEQYRLLQNAVAKHGWKILTVAIYTP